MPDAGGPFDRLRAGPFERLRPGPLDRLRAWPRGQQRRGSALCLVRYDVRAAWKLVAISDDSARARGGGIRRAVSRRSPAGWPPISRGRLLPDAAVGPARSPAGRRVADPARE